MKILAFFILLFPATIAFAAGPSADSIIQKADEIRNPSSSYLMDVEIHSTQTPNDDSKFKVSIKGNDKTLVETLAPPRDRGRNMLMLEENMWVFIPNLNRAVRVGLNQKLTGQASNGDISRMRWTGDYTPAIEKETPDYWAIYLTANKKGLTYDKMRVWVRKKDFRPARAEFLTLAGKLLKTAEYGDYRPLAGAIRPNQIVIKDAIRPDDQSTIKIVGMQVKSFPDSLFNQNSLK